MTCQQVLREPKQLSSQAHPFPPKCGGVFCLGMQGGEALEKLVFLDFASPLVKRRVSEENVNTGLPIGEGV